MNYHSLSAQEPFLQYYPGLSTDSYNTIRDYGEPPSFFDAIFGRNYKEVDFTSSQVKVSEFIAYDAREYGQETNWITEYCSSLGGSYGLTRLEDSITDEGQFTCNDYISQHQNAGDLTPFETVHGTHQGSWFGYVEQDYDDYGVQETGPRLDEMGIFHSLFGHLPCMAQSDNITYNE